MEIKDFPPFQLILKNNILAAVAAASASLHSTSASFSAFSTAFPNNDQAGLSDTPMNDPDSSLQRTPPRIKSASFSRITTPLSAKTHSSSQAFRLDTLDLSYCFKLKVKAPPANNASSGSASRITSSCSSSAAPNGSQETQDFQSQQQPLSTSPNSSASSMIIDEDAQGTASEGLIPPTAVSNLIIRRVLLNDDQLAELMKLIQPNRLESLNLYGCLYLKNPRIACRNLAFLDMSHTIIEDMTLRSIVSSCPSLNTLKLFNCRELHNPNIISDSLVTIDFGYCSGLESPQIMCPNLEDLSVRNTDITDAVLEAILANSGQNNRLKILTITQCNMLEKPRIRSSSLLTINANNCELMLNPVFLCDSLLYLVLAESKMSDDDLERMFLNSSFLSLKSLDIRWCPNIKNPALPSHINIKIAKQ